MRTRLIQATLILLMTASHACVAAPPPAEPVIVQARTPATTQAAGDTLEVRFPTRIEIPSGGTLMLDGRPATEKAAFLGVSVSTVTGALRQQLKLRPGVGLVVNHVEAGSPAEAAGVKRYDILERLDDQVLIEPRQLSVLIRLRKSGDEVKLTLIREATPTTVTAKLAEKDLPALEDVLAPTQVTPWKSATPLGKIIGTKPVSVRDGYNPLAAGGAAGLTWSDGDLTMEILQDKARHLTAKGKDGVVIFDGAIDTSEQLQKLPVEVRAKAMRLIKVDGASTTQPWQLALPASTTQPQNVPYRNTFKSFPRVGGASDTM
jgi:hypothetical protein